jgi:hypothetical protein
MSWAAWRRRVALTRERAKAALNLHATFVKDLTAVYMRTARAAMR